MSLANNANANEGRRSLKGMKYAAPYGYSYGWTGLGGKALL
jgi:hypothetical protein